MKGSPPIAIALHGGAGDLPSRDHWAQCMRMGRAALRDALETGHALLARGAQALDAVVAAVCALEDSGVFNAGRGAISTRDDEHELDAAIMNGATLEAGAAAAVRRIRNPILLARAVMEHSPHVLLCGAGAEGFAHERGLEWASSDYFETARRWQAPRSRQGTETDARLDGAHEARHGTVGAVALDRAGNLAAGTSTGGIAGKHAGRIGDSALIGAGTYASNAACAVSATGAGEYFVRAVAAHEVAALVAYRHMTIDDAVRTVLSKVHALGGDGGLIALDPRGRVAMAFDTPCMYRACIDAAGNRFVGAEPSSRRHHGNPDAR